MEFQIVKRHSKLDYIFVFMLIIYGGRATAFVRSLETWEYFIGLAIPIIFTTLLIIKRKIQFSKNFIYLLIAFLFYFTLLTIKFQEFHPRFLGIYLTSFFIAFGAITLLRNRIFSLYHDVVYYLCIISIIFWSIQQIIPEYLSFLFQFLSFSEPGSINVESNIIFYTINSPEFTEGSYKIDFGSISLFRNSGFAWEPGAFSVFINLAIFINLIITNFNIKGNRKLLILILALITTFSTTGYGIFMLLILFYIYNKDNTYRTLVLPFIILIFIYILYLDFMLEKVIALSEQDIFYLIESSIIQEKKIAAQRISSFYIDLQDFFNNPFLGYGGHDSERWIQKMGAEVYSISGIGKIFAKFGTVGAVFFFTMLVKSSIYLSKLFSFKGWIFPFLMIIMISISYSLIETPLLMCFWMISFMMPKLNKRELNLRLWLIKNSWEDKMKFRHKKSLS